MPLLSCQCGHRFDLDLVPQHNAYVLVSQTAIHVLEDAITESLAGEESVLEPQVRKVISDEMGNAAAADVYRCPSCNRLIVFWDSDPGYVYTLEKSSRSAGAFSVHHRVPNFSSDGGETIDVLSPAPGGSLGDIIQYVRRGGCSGTRISIEILDEEFDRQEIEAFVERLVRDTGRSRHVSRIVVTKRGERLIDQMVPTSDPGE